MGPVKHSFTILQAIPSKFVPGFKKSTIFTRVIILVCLENGHLSFDQQTNDGTDNLVLVKMLAAPVNPSDINQIQGSYPLQAKSSTRVAGNEGVGVIEAVQDGSSSPFKVGDWVIPRKGAFGTWRTRAICSSKDLQVIPRTLPLSVAATLLVNPPTAYRMLLDFVKLKPGILLRLPW